MVDDNEQEEGEGGGGGGGGGENLESLGRCHSFHKNLEFPWNTLIQKDQKSS